MLWKSVRVFQAHVLCAVVAERPCRRLLKAASRASQALVDCSSQSGSLRPVVGGSLLVVKTVAMSRMERAIPGNFDDEGQHQKHGWS
jgi:hypothetical protein